MKIKSLFFITYTAMAIGIIGLVLLIIFIVNNQNDLNKAQEIRYLSYQRADELRQSSDDLTRLARTYVISGDEKYEKMYWDILAIRNGQKARPENYERIYWDLVLQYGTKPRPDGETVALNQMMKELGFTEQEFGLLTQAQNNSDALVTTETIAMNAVKGLYDDGAGNYTVRKAPDMEMARRIMHDDKYHADKYIIMEPIDKFFQSLDKRTGTAVMEYKNISNNLLIGALVLASFLVVAIVLIGFLVTRRILRQLGTDPSVIEEVTSRVADGDLEIELKNREKAEGVYKSMFRMLDSLKTKASFVENIAQGNLRNDIVLSSDIDGLGKSIIKMQDTLNDVLGQVNRSVEQVLTGSSQVAQSSTSLSQGASEQASSLEEISASINQIAGQSRQNAENALQANSLAKAATENAEGGNKQMFELVTSMQKINDSSEEIKKIVKVIDDIAFQINLLALNANVEAARAGKYGKGFAVVADEVRNLAVKSAESVKETTTMVEEALKNVEIGNQAADRTARQLNEIVVGINKVAELVEEIASASKEQAQGIEQINAGLDQVDRVTQSNTANAEESASAADELASQVRGLKKMVDRFQLADVRYNQNTGLSNDELQRLVMAEVLRIQQQGKGHVSETGIKVLKPEDVISLDR